LPSLTQPIASLPAEPSISADRRLMERRKALLGPVYRAFYSEPVHLVSGSGVWLRDAHGNTFLDAYNNVPSVGHCHPHVVAALATQAAKLNTHTRYLSEVVLDYVEKLLRTCPSALKHAMFTCTGSEANDLALRIAQHASGGTGVVITKFAYHGATIATSQLSPGDGGASIVAPHDRTVDAPDTYRNGGNGADDFAESVRRAIDSMTENGIKPAALLIDSAFSSDGIFFPKPQVMQKAAAYVKAAGAVLIADEVQAGFGRFGNAMWGFQHYGLEPDIVTLGKPMGAGHPIGGLIVTPEVIGSFAARSGYFNTFGGNPVAAAVGIAVLEVIESESLMDNARTVGAYLGSRLRQLQHRHPIIGDVRNCGLYFGVEFSDESQTGQSLASATVAFVNEMRRRGVLISSCGPEGNILKIRPPLPFSQANADQLVETMDGILSRR